VAVVAASVSIVAPARADTWGGWYFLKNSHTANCLATDYSAAVYTFPGCNVGQRWQFQYLDAYPGWAVIWNQVTSRCLMASNHPQVVSSGACDGSRAEFRWHWYYSNLQNAKTNTFLHNAGATTVILSSYHSTRGVWIQVGG
jgi:hypothetical protein